jgi:predicted nucleotidyltransferase
MRDLARAIGQLRSIFEQLQLTYAVMGGIAVRAYGIPRATYDVDFTVAIPRARLGEFYTCAEQAGYTVPEAYRTGWVEQVSGMPLVKLRTYLEGRGVDVDLFLAESAFQTELLARRRQETVDGEQLWLISPEDLILLKLVAFRPRDQADIGDVLFTQGRLDEAYLRRWAAPLGVAERLDQVLSAPQ